MLETFVLSIMKLSAGSKAVDQVKKLAEPLKGVRVLHINATPYGGEVAEFYTLRYPFFVTLGW